VIVGQWYTRGEPPRGVATVEYAEVQQAYAEEAMEALPTQKIPKDKQDLVRDYYDALRDLQKAAKAESSPAPTPAPPK
jgi:hypothetical protein